jgi:predicted DNA-binding transcriptional regulator YafY
VLDDGSAVEEVAVGSEEWLLGEILSFRGEAVVREPEELRRRIATRAHELQSEMGLARVRVPATR